MALLSRRMDHHEIILNLFLGSEIEGDPTNIYLRRHDTSIESTPLLGPQSPAAVHIDARGTAPGPPRRGADRAGHKVFF